MSLLAVFDDQAAAGNAPPPEVCAAAATEVIDIINREVPAAALQQPDEASRRQLGERIAALLNQALRRRGFTPGAAVEAALAGELIRRLLGLGFLDLLLPPGRTDLSEITVYSSGLVQVMPKGSVRWQSVPLQPEPEEVARVLDRLLAPQNKSLNETNPSVNARLARTPANPGGGRIKALHRVIAPPGRNHAFNIRLYEQRPVLPEWLIERQALSAAVMATLGQGMAAGRRILITGGTRTGKTTLLSALCSFLPQAWRILKIEDPEEIWIERASVQTIEARPQAVGTEVRPYTLADGVDDAMRLSPDYLIIGEVRDGRAAQALFRALLTGHSGACTFHADSPHEAASRLATILGADAGVRKSDANQMIADGLDLLVQIGIRHERRIVTTLAKVAPQLSGGEVCFEPLWRYDEASPPDAPAWEKLAEL